MQMGVKAFANKMKKIDVFNGDADGICALIQLRLVQPREAELVTGIKRDIKLLDKVEVQKGDEVTVLDISMDKNKSALSQILQEGAKVLYIDHHLAGDIPEVDNLNAIINTDPKVCTSLLTNQFLQGAHSKWAIVGAYGDNMQASAESLCQQHDIPVEDQSKLQKLGIAINYNGYGASIEDLHYHPAELFRSLLKYKDPLDCTADPASIYKSLYSAYELDISKTTSLQPEYTSESVAVYMLPDERWARRVSGVFGNSLANRSQEKAHAIVSHHPQGGYVVSVRAPKAKPKGAGTLCNQFPNGGGREGAAGINQLPEHQLETFIKTFEETYQ